MHTEPAVKLGPSSVSRLAAFTYLHDMQGKSHTHKTTAGSNPQNVSICLSDQKSLGPIYMVQVQIHLADSQFPQQSTCP